MGGTDTTQTLLGSHRLKREEKLPGLCLQLPLVIEAAEQLPGLSKPVRTGPLGGGEAEAWSQLGLGIVHKRAVVLHGECGPQEPGSC